MSLIWQNLEPQIQGQVIITVRGG